MKTGATTITRPAAWFRPWVGVVLSFFIAGASQFLAGKRLAGILWLAGLLALEFVGFICLASPLFPGDAVAFGVFAGTFLLWMVMLVQSYRPVPRFARKGWVAFIVLYLLLGWVAAVGIRIFVQPFRIPTAAMSPTLRGRSDRVGGGRGDQIMLQRYAYWFSKPKRGDIIVFKTTGISEAERQVFHISPNEYYLKRIAGVPGDVLSFQDGRLCDHGRPVTEPPGLAKLVFPGTSGFGLVDQTKTYVVPAASYYVVGDNTTNSLDSRYYGAIAGNSILGKVSKVYLPLDRAGVVR